MRERTLRDCDACWTCRVMCVLRRYCPARSAAPTAVPSGHYSLPESVETAEIRTGIQVCGPGSYCVTGQRWPCPGGTYNDSFGRASVCSTPCPPGECRVMLALGQFGCISVSCEKFRSVARCGAMASCVCICRIFVPYRNWDTECLPLLQLAQLALPARICGSFGDTPRVVCCADARGAVFQRHSV